jgi:hypothetical protein
MIEVRATGQIPALVADLLDLRATSVAGLAQGLEGPVGGPPRVDRPSEDGLDDAGSVLAVLAPGVAMHQEASDARAETTGFRRVTARQKSESVAEPFGCDQPNR